MKIINILIEMSHPRILLNAIRYLKKLDCENTLVSVSTISGKVDTIYHQKILNDELIESMETIPKKVGFTPNQDIDIIKLFIKNEHAKGHDMYAFVSFNLCLELSLLELDFPNLHLMC